MQPVRVEAASGEAEVMVGISRSGQVWLAAQSAQASVVAQLNAAQAQLLARALMQAATAVTVREAA